MVRIRILSGSMHYFFQVPHKQKSNRLTEREAILFKQLTWVQLQILKPWNQRSSTEVWRRLALNHYMFCLSKCSFGTSDSSIILTVSKGERRSSLSSRPFSVWRSRQWLWQMGSLPTAMTYFALLGLFYDDVIRNRPFCQNEKVASAEVRNSRTHSCRQHWVILGPVFDQFFSLFVCNLL